MADAQYLTKLSGPEVLTGADIPAEDTPYYITLAESNAVYTTAETAPGVYRTTVVLELECS